MRHHSIPVNDSLNKSTRKAGLPWQLWLACVVFAGVVMAILSVPFGLLLLAGLPAIFVLFFKQDERIFELACCSVVQKSYYDPGKVRS
jgi:type IV secretory pathway VirB3-like protein